ncbi:MAG TPA: condensation domain-containing protein, partial [Thermomicrobiales bacterium]|nr:condensation domain-containing protein [Thermomicrobiales bacterium]
MLEHARPRRIGRRQPVPAPALANDAAPTPPDAPPTIAPLLPAQRRLWLLQRLFPGVAAYVVPIALQLEGRLDEASLQRALDALVERHPALRTTIVDADGTLVQRVSPAATLPLTYPRLRRKTTGRDVEGEASAPRLLVGEALRAPFDLEAGPLVRAQLVKRAPRSHLLLLLVHRLVCDDDSIRTLIRDLGALYRAFAAGLPNPLPPLPIAAHEIAAAEHAARDGD